MDSLRSSSDSRIIGIDPGGTTGVCIYVPWSRDIIVHEVSGRKELWKKLVDCNPDPIVIERFDYRRHLSNADLTAVENIGVVKLYADLTNKAVVEQQQLKGHKGLWTNDKLKALELYRAGMPHAMDALRQVLYYVTTKLNDDYWIRRYREVV